MDWKGDDIDIEHVVEPEDGGNDDAASKVKKLKSEIEKLKQEKQEYLDGWQRSKADYVNLLRRSEEQGKEQLARGVAKAVEELFPAFDALERAKEHGELPPGFEAIAKQLETAFASLGLAATGKVGEPFDPVLHEAVGQDAAKSKEEDGMISAVFERGWKIADRVIRPAKVKVAHYQ